MRPLPALFLLPVLLLFTSNVHADVYKCTDANGRITYTNDPAAARGCTRLDSSQAVSTVPAPAARPAVTKPAAGASNGFPRVSTDTQRNRDQVRREVLQRELSEEQEALRAAESAFDTEDQIRLGDERNYQKKLDRLQPFQDKLDLHRRNIEALEKELQRLR